jgi:hypothetical protein
MAKLSSKARKALPKSDFAVPSKAPGPGSFPIPDKPHARAALRLEGNASPSERKTISAKAKKMLGKGGKRAK